MIIGPGLDRLRLDQLHQGGFCLYSPKADGESATLTSMMQQGNDTEPTGQTASSDWSDRPKPTGIPDRSDRSNADWLQQRIEHYRDKANDMCEAIEDLDDLDKLGQGFMSADPLEKVDIQDRTIPRPTFVNANLSFEYKADLIKLLKEYVDCFAWSYSEMPGLSHDLVEHRLPIKAGFRPYKQPSRRFNPVMYDRIKEEINRLLDAGFIRSCRYAEWISNIVPIEKKIRARLEFLLILEILIKLRLKRPLDVLVSLVYLSGLL